MAFQIIREPGFLRTVITGRLTRQEVIAVGLAMQEIELASTRIPDRMTDVGGVEISELTGEDVQEFARRRRQARYPNAFRHAILAPEPVQFGYARMFQTLIDHPDITTQVFREEAAAIAWLSQESHRPPMSDAPPPGRSTITLVVHRLTYAELWRMANRNWLGFLLLVQAKLTKSSRLDYTHTSAFAPTILQPADAEIPTHALDRLTSARAQYADLGFRYLGIDEDVLRTKGCLAYFVRGPVFAYQAISPVSNFAMLLSYPEARQPIATANGRSPVDNSALYDSLLLPKARIATVLARHLERIAAFNLPDLSDAEILAHLEQNARQAQALQIARGVFVPNRWSRL